MITKKQLSPEEQLGKDYKEVFQVVNDQLPPSNSAAYSVLMDIANEAIKCPVEVLDHATYAYYHGKMSMFELILKKLSMNLDIVRKIVVFNKQEQYSNMKPPQVYGDPQ